MVLQLAPARTGFATSEAATEEALVRDNFALVRYAVAEVATRLPRHVSRDDLVSAGMLGLAQAARSFEVDRGIEFPRYAKARIRGALLDELRSRDWASRSVRALARRTDSATDRLTSQLQRRPDTDEVAREMGVDAETLRQLAADVDRATVLNYESILFDGGWETLLPAGATNPADEVVGRERVGYLMDAVRTLPERLRAVVVGYFFQERPMQEIGDELGVTESRVSQMRGEALLLLRDGMNAQLDPDAVAPEQRPNGRIARRKAAYYDSIAAASDYRTRIEAGSRSFAENLVLTTAS